MRQLVVTTVCAENSPNRLAGPNYKWVVVGLLFLAGFLNLEDRVVIFSVMPLIRAELQLTDFFVGALMSAFLWTYALASPFAGYLGDRLSRKRVIVSCLFLWSVVTIAAGAVKSPTQLMTTRVLLAITEAFFLPAALALVADHHTPATRAKAVAMLVVGMNLGPILGGAAAGWIGDHYGWRPTLYVLGFAGILLALILAKFLHEAPVGTRHSSAGPAPERSSLAATMSTILHTPSAVVLMLALGLFAVGVWMLITWLPIFLYDSFKMTLAQAGFFGNLAITGPIFIGAIVGGVLSDHVGAARPRRRMLLLIIFYAQCRGRSCFNMHKDLCSCW